jgi:hypothetical protein
MDQLSAWEITIVRLGIFVIFLITFGDFVFHKIWPVIGPPLQRLADRFANSRKT